MAASPSIARRGALAFSASLLLLFLALIAAGLHASRQEASGVEAGASAPRGVTVFLVRHTEKGTDDPTDPTLTEEGEERAEALARLLSRAGVSHLYSTDYRRTRATLAPLAAAGELEIALYDAGKPTELVSVLGALPPGSVAVVAGHSNTTPALYEALGAGTARELATSKYGSQIPDADHDRLYVVTLLASPEEPAKCVGAFELRYGK